MGFIANSSRHVVGLLKIPAVAATLSFILGFVIARLMPPFVLEDAFWRDFWTGPPAAGIFAVLAASIAYGAAVHSAATSKQTANEENARKQMEMAINMAVDDSSTKRTVGLNLLYVLMGKHDPSLDDLIFSVVVQLSTEKVDADDANDDNGREAGDDNAS